MNNVLPKPIVRLIEELTRLPGIGPKMAARLTMYLCNRSEGELKELSLAVAALNSGIVRCRECYQFADQSVCVICRDPDRESGLCVVEEPLDVVAIEKSRSWRGRYHVLGGVISPIDGIGPEQLTIDRLLKRITADSTITEVVLATNPSLEGEATASYLKEQLNAVKRPLTVTRIARGIPTGGALEYADTITLSRALEGRREF